MGIGVGASRHWHWHRRGCMHRRRHMYRHGHRHGHMQVKFTERPTVNRPHTTHLPTTYDAQRCRINIGWPSGILLHTCRFSLPFLALDNLSPEPCKHITGPLCILGETRRHTQRFFRKGGGGGKGGGGCRAMGARCWVLVVGFVLPMVVDSIAGCWVLGARRRCWKPRVLGVGCGLLGACRRV